MRESASPIVAFLRASTAGVWEVLSLASCSPRDEEPSMLPADEARACFFASLGMVIAAGCGAKVVVDPLGTGGGGGAGGIGAGGTGPAAESVGPSVGSVGPSVGSVGPGPVGVGPAPARAPARSPASRRARWAATARGIADHA